MTDVETLLTTNQIEDMDISVLAKLGAMVRYRNMYQQSIKGKIVRFDPANPTRVIVRFDTYETDVDIRGCEIIRLRDSMPHEFVGGEYHDTQAYGMRDVPVVREVYARDYFTKWPGKQKNVYFWVVLANGKAVGFNENPSKGWSFPVITFKQ
jgi:hypothetical protein